MSTLHIVMKDWEFDCREYGISTPFAFWTVVDQSMLYHWFDLAQETDYERVLFHCNDPDLLKAEFFDREYFWPVRCEFTSEEPPEDEVGLDYSVVTVDSLTGCGLSLESPDIWEMIDRHRNLVDDRLEILWSLYRDVAPGLPVGARTRVHPDAKLIEPYWIGNDCEIGEGCVIGPDACIGDNSCLEKGVSVSFTHLGKGSVVGEDVELNSHFVEEGILFNRDNRVWHKSVDPLILSFEKAEEPAF